MHSLVYGFCSSDQRFARRVVYSPHPASFRFHLTMDTLAAGYILPTTGRIPDLHRLETCAAGRTHTKKTMSSDLSENIAFSNFHEVLLTLISFRLLPKLDSHFLHLHSLNPGICPNLRPPTGLPVPGTSLRTYRSSYTSCNR